MGNDKEKIKELEKLIDRTIPIVDEIVNETVGVKYEGEKVIGLGLYYCRLTDIPEIIGELENLQILNLSANELTSLPEFLRKLKTLHVLYLAWNNFESLPESIGQLEGLQSLDLSGMKVIFQSDGFKIPEGLRALRTLLVRENDIKTLPDTLFGLNKLKDFHTLNLAENSLSSLPDSFGDLKNLQTLILEKNNFDSFPNVLFQITNLQTLDLEENPLKSLPETFGELKTLKKINLRGTELQVLPESFGQLTSLQFLDLSYSRFTTLPEIITRLTNLQTLVLYSNKFQTLPESFGNLTNLQSLDLTRNGQFVSFPESFFHLTNLRELKLHSGRLRILPENIGNLTSLTYLDLGSNRISSLPETFGNLENLQTLDLSWNRVLEALPNSFGNLKSLQYVNLKTNSLKALPKSIENLISLKIFIIHENPITWEQVTGDTLEVLETLKNRGVVTKGILCPICSRSGGYTFLDPYQFYSSTLLSGKKVRCPHQCGELYSYEKSKAVAEELEVWEWLEGQIGQILVTACDPQKHTYLKVRGGYITGLWLNKCNLTSLPESFGNLKKIKTLVLSNNKLSSLPKTLQNLKDLQTLKLESNRLTAIPTFLWSLKNLSTLDFGGNPLRAEDESIAQKPPEFILDYLRKKATIRVFISHAMKDYEKYRIKELAQYLEQQEEISEVYICEEHLVGNIDEWMLEMVPQSELLLFIATQKSVFDSPDCRNEIDLANKFSIPAVPLKTVEVDWIDLIELRMARELGKEFKVEHFDTLCQDLYQYIYELKRNINLMERDRRVTDLSTIYEQFQITYKNLERKFEHKIRSLEERVKLLEKRFN